MRSFFLSQTGASSSKLLLILATNRLQDRQALRASLAVEGRSNEV